VKGDELIRNYFRDSGSALRRFVESIKIGETLLAREIMERAGLSQTSTSRVLRMLRDRGMVEVIPYVWPEKPPYYDLLGTRGLARWRKSVRGSARGFPGASYRFLGFTAAPVDDVLHLAHLDLGLETPPRPTHTVTHTRCVYPPRHPAHTGMEGVEH